MCLPVHPATPQSTQVDGVFIETSFSVLRGYSIYAMSLDLSAPLWQSAEIYGLVCYCIKYKLDGRVTSSVTRLQEHLLDGE